MTDATDGYPTGPLTAQRLTPPNGAVPYLTVLSSYLSYIPNPQGPAAGEAPPQKRDPKEP